MTEAGQAVDGNEEGLDEPAAPEPPETIYDVPVTWSRDQRVLHPGREQLLATAETMKNDGWVSVVDLCGVDYLNSVIPRLLPDGVTPERFEVVINMINHARRERCRLRIQVPESDPTVPSLFDLFPGTEAMERETYDMFGITFADHPFLTRILMPENWEGHPLRKDFGVGSVPVQFKLDGARDVRSDAQGTKR